MEPDLDAALRNLLEEERHRAGGADEERKRELRSLISNRESELASANLLQAFKNYIAGLPDEARPKSELQEYRLFSEWEASLKQELAGWKDDLDKLNAKAPDGLLIYNSARERVLKALEAQALESGLLPQTPRRRETPEQRPITANANPASADMSGWMSFVQLGKWGNIDPSGGSSIKPICFREPNGNEMPIRSWPFLLFQTAEWLVRKGFIAKANCPVTIGTNQYVINTEPVNGRGTKFHGAKELSNGLYLESNRSAKDAARQCVLLLTKFGQDPAQFHVRLG